MSAILLSGQRAARRLRKKAESKNFSVDCYVPSETTVVWNLILNNQRISLALDLVTLDIWYKDRIIPGKKEKSSNGSKVIKFVLEKHNFCITINNNIHNNLNIDGSDKTPDVDVSLTMNDIFIPNLKLSDLKSNEKVNFSFSTSLSSSHEDEDTSFKRANDGTGIERQKVPNSMSIDQSKLSQSIGQISLDFNECNESNKRSISKLAMGIRSATMLTDGHNNLNRENSSDQNAEDKVPYWDAIYEDKKSTKPIWIAKDDKDRDFLDSFGINEDTVGSSYKNNQYESEFLADDEEDYIYDDSDDDENYDNNDEEERKKKEKFKKRNSKEADEKDEDEEN